MRRRTTLVRDAVLFGALADPNRLRLLERIGQQPGIDQISLLADEQVRPTTVAHHLRVLCLAGLVVREHDGARARYRQAPQALDDLAGALRSLTARPPRAHAPVPTIMPSGTRGGACV